MVGEFPELQGDMGRSYALAQKVEPRVAEAIAEHYQPKGASDPTAPSAEGALVAIADRLDTLVGCCAVGIMPTGSADPLALRRAAIGLVRTIIDKQWTLGIAELVRTAHAGLSDIKLDLNEDETATKLAEFLRQRLRGVLTEQYPHDAVDACLEADPDKPHDVTLRVAALSRLSTGQRAQVGEVFKRAANIAKDAPAGEPKPPSDVVSEVHDSEAALYDAYTRLVESLEAARLREDYASALDAIAGFAPVLGKFFDDVFVMTEEALVRENRLRLMQAIHASCSGLASFNLLAKK
jgi:glycyl-tRNA synthetase beta chain